MPIAAIVGDRIICMHGGLSPELESLEQIRDLHRPTEVPEDGLLADLLWSDPEPRVHGWGYNSRGVSYTFGTDLCGFQPLVWGVPTKLQNSLARSNQSRFG